MPSLGVQLELLVKRLSFSGRIAELVGYECRPSLPLPVPESLPEKETTYRKANMREGQRQIPQ